MAERQRKDPYRLFPETWRRLGILHMKLLVAGSNPAHSPNLADGEDYRYFIGEKAVVAYSSALINGWRRFQLLPVKKSRKALAEYRLIPRSIFGMAKVTVTSLEMKSPFPFIPPDLLKCRSVAQFGSVLGLGPSGRRFKSYRSDQY